MFTYRWRVRDTFNSNQLSNKGRQLVTKFSFDRNILQQALSCDNWNITQNCLKRQTECLPVAHTSKILQRKINFQWIKLTINWPIAIKLETITNSTDNAITLFFDWKYTIFSINWYNYCIYRNIHMGFKYLNTNDYVQEFHLSTNFAY